jgi:signal transduction histidine kinase
MGHLASRLGGEMRQPLTVMRNAVHLLKSNLGSDLDEKARRYFNLLLGSVDEMDGIVANLGGLVGTQIRDRRVNSVDELVSLALLRVHARPGVAIETALDPAAVLFGDPTQLRLALTNIVNNSVQAIPREGLVRIVCQNVGKETRVVISDNGPGMTEEVRALAPQPLFTLSFHRVGIGLTVAQRLVGACGGNLAIESAPGAGTTVTLTFPRYEGP